MIETPLRPRRDISHGWEFKRGRVRRGWLAGRGKAGEPVGLPHCWNRKDTFQHGHRSYSGRGAYRKLFEFPDTPGGPGFWKLRSQGFYGWGDVWIDGRTIARIDGQYSERGTHAGAERFRMTSVRSSWFSLSPKFPMFSITF